MYADIFADLGRRLADFGRDARSREVIAAAVAANEWFCEESILLSISSIRSQMLAPSALTQWLAAYPYDFAAQRGKLGIVMAGNIPAVGFFDLMCGLVCGYQCHVKRSSRDAILMGYLIDTLGIKVFDGLPAEGLDALIASGSDATMALVDAQYKATKKLLRGSRSSVAIISKSGLRSAACGLRQDVFAHNGLGCRNVSHLFLPEQFEVQRLVEAFAPARAMVPMWRGNYLQTKALRTLQGEPFIDGGFFLLRRSDDFPEALCELTYQFYADRSQVDQWLAAHREQVQCVVGAGHIPFGQAQFPALTEYPDGRDVIEFLCRE